MNFEVQETNKILRQITIGMEIEENGVESAYKKDVEDFFKESEEEMKKDFKKEFKKDADFRLITQQADWKLEFIGYALCFKDAKKVKESLPFLVEKLREIANDLEGLNDK